MKKLYIFALVATMFAACATDAIDEQSVKVEEQTPDTLVGTFEGDDSRIQLNEAQKTVWTKGDLVSVFYRSNANQKWQYQGETGERTGTIKRVANAEATQELSDIVVVYPYNENYYINPRTYNVQAYLPAEQTYLANSYGLDGNIMISASEYKSFSLKNVCGWLKIQLTGTSSQKVTSITLKGNNGEQVAGEIYINSADATSTLASEMGGADDGENSAGGNLVFDDTILTEVVLNCGEGVTLSSEETAFYIALPPQTFEKGLTIDVACSDGSTMTKSTENAIAIERNCILPMATLAYEGVVPNNQIWYTSTDDNIVTPTTISAFGANIISNVYENGQGIITFDAPVTTIGERAFRKCSTLSTVRLPEGVTNIGLFAFGECSSLTSITIPQSTTEIAERAFVGCKSLAAFYGKFASKDNHCLIVDGVLNSFALGCGVTYYTIPDGVTSIGAGAFSSANKIMKIFIPNSVTSIGDWAFQYCNELTNITIPDSVTSIGHTVFSRCDELISVTIPDGVTSIEKSTFFQCISLTSVTIPDSVTSIGEFAFHACDSLKNVYYNGDISAWCKIDFVENPLSYGAKLYLQGIEATEITIPSDITTIKDYTFKGCGSLTSVTIPDNITEIGQEAFYRCESLTSVTIGNSVTSIVGGVFMGCSSLKSVTIPNSVTLIGEQAFYLCESLTSIAIPDSVTSIGKEAFGGCYSLTSITIPDTVTSIGDEAFGSCSSLGSITIPANVTYIGGGAFCSCSSLKEVYCKSTTPPTGGNGMFGYSWEYSSVCKIIYVPTASVEAYKAAQYWSNYASYIEGYEF